MSPRPPFPPVRAKSGKQRVVIGIMLAVVLLGGVISFMRSGSKDTRPAEKKSQIVTITLPPPPPPPPPPPKVEPPPPADEPPKTDDMVEMEPEDLMEPPPEAPAEPPSEVLGTNIKGDGPGLAGLGARGNGGGLGNRIGGGGGSAQARIDWYAKRILVTTITDALKRDSATKSLELNHGIRVWVDKDGRITRIRTLGSTSNLAAIERVLIGLRTSQAPPSGMPTYIDFKIRASRPTS